MMSDINALTDSLAVGSLDEIRAKVALLDRIDVDRIAVVFLAEERDRNTLTSNGEES